MAKRLLIGNGLSALEKPLGHIIDNNFDEVIRLSWFKTKGYERSVGTKTDIVSTIFWKYRPAAMDGKKLILVNHYDLTFENDSTMVSFNKEVKNGSDRILYVHQRNDDNELKEYFKKFIPTFNYENLANFTLGFRTIFILKKLFPDDELWTYGFDYFSPDTLVRTATCGGWYWDPSHNQNVERKHPYVFEKLALLKMISEKEIYTLNSVSKVQ